MFLPPCFFFSLFLRGLAALGESLITILHFFFQILSRSLYIYIYKERKKDIYIYLTSETDSSCVNIFLLILCAWWYVLLREAWPTWLVDLNTVDQHVYRSHGLVTGYLPSTRGEGNDLQGVIVDVGIRVSMECPLYPGWHSSLLNLFSSHSSTYTPHRNNPT